MHVAAATDELTVDYDDLERKLSDRTRVVAFALASNATGSVADAQRICRLAREAGALSWIDAVHYAAHEPIDVEELGCDVLLCSPYKFCGPHLGIAYLRAGVAPSPGGRTRRGPSPIEPARPQLRDRARRPTSCSPASARRSPTSTRSAGWPRCASTSASSRRGSSRGLPDNVRALRLPPDWRAGCRPSSSTSTASTPSTCREPPGERGIGVWSRRQLVLRRPRRPAAADVAPDRPDPLQHRRRGRPPPRRARARSALSRFDAVIVGSGVNSLACARAARARRLERLRPRAQRLARRRDQDRRDHRARLPPRRLLRLASALGRRRRPRAARRRARRARPRVPEHRPSDRDRLPGRRGGLPAPHRRRRTPPSSTATRAGDGAAWQRGARGVHAERRPLVRPARHRALVARGRGARREGGPPPRPPRAGRVRRQRARLEPRLAHRARSPPSACTACSRPGCCTPASGPTRPRPGS